MRDMYMAHFGMQRMSPKSNSTTCWVFLQPIPSRCPRHCVCSSCALRGGQHATLSCYIARDTTRSCIAPAGGPRPCPLLPPPPRLFFAVFWPRCLLARAWARRRGFWRRAWPGRRPSVAGIGPCSACWQCPPVSSASSSGWSARRSSQGSTHGGCGLRQKGIGPLGNQWVAPVHRAKCGISYRWCPQPFIYRLE